mgnify:CR=1 FL=1
MALTLEEELRGEQIMQRDKEKLDRIAKMQKTRMKAIKEQKKDRQRKLNSVRKKVRKKEERILMQSLGIFREKLVNSRQQERGGQAAGRSIKENILRKEQWERRREGVLRKEREAVEVRLREMENENRRIQANISRIRQKKQKSLDKLFQRYW